MPAAPRAASVWLSESGPASSIWRVFAGDVFRWMPIVQRLKTRPQFQVTLACGIVSRTAHFALHRSPLDRSPAGDSRPDHAGPDARPLFGVQDVWVGAMVPKRWARRAVTRNTIKRQIYQVSATFEPRLAAAAHVVRLRATFDRSQFISATSDVLKRAVRAELEQLFGRVADTGLAEQAA
jgi:ribonuclease P protein component